MGTIKYSIAIRCDKPGTKKAQITSTKAYPVLQLSGNLTMMELAEHIADHGSKYTRGDIYAILAEAVDCIRHEILDGNSVQLGDLGIFAPGIKCTGAASASTLSASNITAVKVNFRAGKRFDNLRDDATFECVPSREAQALAVAEARAQETLEAGDNNGLE
mgnify:CR=1 FL=1